MKKRNGTSDAGTVSSNGNGFWPTWQGDRVHYVLVVILLVYVIFWIGSAIRNNLQKFERIGFADRGAPTITVEGTGTIQAAPNIATVQVGLLSEGKDVSGVQQENSTKMNALLAEFKKLGIAEKDLQTTTFSINPKYDFRDGRSTISGYQVSQSVTVKVRDLKRLGEVFARSGALGANQVYGPTFTIEDEETLKSEARQKAIAAAREKLMVLSRDLGVRPVRLVAWSENTSRPPGPGVYLERAAVGGGPTAPDVQPGELEISVGVSITYEVR